MELNFILTPIKDKEVDKTIVSVDRPEIKLSSLSNHLSTTNSKTARSKENIIIKCLYAENESIPKEKGIIIKSTDHIVELKKYVSFQNGINIDSIDLFTEKLIKVNDNECISKFMCLSKDLNAINDALSKSSTRLNSVNKSARNINFYYKITSFKIEVEVEYLINFEKSKIIFDLALTCQMFMLKYLLYKKLKNSFPINDQILSFCKIDSVSIDLELFSSGTVILNDNFTLEDVMKTQFDLNLNKSSNSFPDSDNGSKKIIRLILSRKIGRKISFGLDFGFNLLKNIFKIEFDKEAPSHRQTNHGINVFSYCRNNLCEIYNSIFVKCFGFGKFNLIKEIQQIKCPLCKSGSILAVNIGYVNCEWIYKGTLLNKNNSAISGDGFTIDDKVYIFKETDLLSQFNRLEINVSKLPNLNDPVRYSTINSSDSSFSDVDIQFSILRKDLFKENNTSNNEKNYINYIDKKNSRSDIKKILTNSLQDCNIKPILSTKNLSLSDKYINSHGASQSEDAFNIKMDTKKTDSYCYCSVSKENEGSKIGYKYNCLIM